MSVPLPPCRLGTVCQRWYFEKSNELIWCARPRPLAQPSSSPVAKQGKDYKNTTWSSCQARLSKVKKTKCATTQTRHLFRRPPLRSGSIFPKACRAEESIRCRTHSATEAIFFSATLSPNDFPGVDPIENEARSFCEETGHNKTHRLPEAKKMSSVIDRTPVYAVLERIAEPTAPEPSSATANNPISSP